MPTQLPLRFDDVPITCPVQERYHAIAPVLAGRVTPIDRARVPSVSYATVMRWISEFRDKGMPGLFDQTQFPRRPTTPEKVVVLLVFYKCCAPKASDRELSRVISSLTGHRLHNETVHALLERYFFWKHPEFLERIHYPVPNDPRERRTEMVRLRNEGWSEKTTAALLGCTRTTVRKWVRRFQQEAERGLEERSRAPQRTRRKVFLGAIHAVLEIQKKYGYAGWFRIKGYLERDYGIEIGETTIKKIMRLNRRVHLAPSRPLDVKVRDPREGPPISHHPFEHVL
jgi:transposase